MNAPTEWSEIIGQKKYDVETATLIAGNDYWDGNNYERQGRQSFLYRTAKENYFCINLTQWQGERNTLQPCSMDDALAMWEVLTERRVSYEEAFPGVEVEEA